MRRDGARDFPGRVALIGLLRIVHVVGVVGVGAAVTRGEPGAPFLSALVFSGLAIALLDHWARRNHFTQAGGLAVMLKASVLVILFALGSFGETAFWCLLVFSVAIAHAPGRVRHWRLF